MVICLGGIAGPASGNGVDTSAAPMFSIWAAVMGTHSLLFSSSTLISSTSQSQAIALAHTSSSHMVAYIQYQPIQYLLSQKTLICTTSNLILTASVGFAPIKFLISFSI